MILDFADLWKNYGRDVDNGASQLPHLFNLLSCQESSDMSLDENCRLLPNLELLSGFVCTIPGLNFDCGLCPSLARWFPRFQVIVWFFVTTVLQFLANRVSPEACLNLRRSPFLLLETLSDYRSSKPRLNFRRWVFKLLGLSGILIDSQSVLHNIVNCKVGIDYCGAALVTIVEMTPSAFDDFRCLLCLINWQVAFFYQSLYDVEFLNRVCFAVLEVIAKFFFDYLHGWLSSLWCNSVGLKKLRNLNARIQDIFDRLIGDVAKFSSVQHRLQVISDERLNPCWLISQHFPRYIRHQFAQSFRHPNNLRQLSMMM